MSEKFEMSNPPEWAPNFNSEITKFVSVHEILARVKSVPAKPKAQDKGEEFIGDIAVSGKIPAPDPTVSEVKQAMAQIYKDHPELTEACKKLNKALKKADTDKNEHISSDEIAEVLNKVVKNPADQSVAALLIDKFAPEQETKTR